MPTYRYRCEIGHEFEIDQRITEDSLETCTLDRCGAPVKKVYSPFGVSWQGYAPSLEDFWSSGEPSDIPVRGH